MSNFQNQSASSISDGSQVRYHKAVKQISKLININANFRKQLDHYKNICENLQSANQNLRKNYDLLQNDRRYFEEKTKKLEQQLKSMQVCLAESKNDVYSEEYLQKVREEYEKKVQQLEDKLNEQGQTIINFQEKSAKTQSQNMELRAQLENLSKQMTLKYKQLQKQKNKQIDEIKTKMNEITCHKCVRRNDRENSIESWGKKVDSENIELRKKITLLEIQSPANCPVFTEFSRNTRVRSRSVADYFHNGFHERLRSLETSRNQERLISAKKIEKLESKIKAHQHKKIREKLTAGKIVYL